MFWNWHNFTGSNAESLMRTCTDAIFISRHPLPLIYTAFGLKLLLKACDHNSKAGNILKAAVKKSLIITCYQLCTCETCKLLSNFRCQFWPLYFKFVMLRLPTNNTWHMRKEMLFFNIIKCSGWYIKAEKCKLCM